jgi:putative selenium metabolism hydrolase
MDPVELTTSLVRTPGLSGSESAVADCIERALQALEFHTVARDKLGAVYGVIGPRETEVAVLFDGHMDVVPVTDGWTVDPFGAEIIGERLYGRGATDMKGGLAAAICGVAAAAATGRLRRQVAVSATVLEEMIEGVSLAHVLDRLRPAAVVICEPSGLELKLGQRGRMEILLEHIGVPAHAAHPQRGMNPVDFMARSLIALSDVAQPTDPLLGDGILVSTDIVSGPYPSISMIPRAVTVRFDRRTLVGETAQGVLGEIDRVLTPLNHAGYRLRINDDEVTTYTGLTLRPPRELAAWKLDPSHALAIAARAAFTETGVPLSVGAFGVCTNGSESAGRRRIPTIGIGPGAESDCHIIDESVAVSQIRLAAHLYRNLCLQVAGD